MKKKILILSPRTRKIVNVCGTVWVADIGCIVSYIIANSEKKILLAGLIVFAILPVIISIWAIIRDKKHYREANEPTGDYYYIEGRKYSANGKYEKAIEFYFKAIPYYPKDATKELAKVHFGIGDAHRMNRENHRNDTVKIKELTDNAIDSFKEAFSLHEDAATARKLRDLHRDKGEFGSEWEEIYETLSKKLTK